MDYRFASYNLPFLVALTMAVPGIGVRIRLKVIVFGLAALFLIDVLMLVVGMLGHYATLAVNGQPFFSATWVTILHYAERFAVRLNGEVPPLLIWAGLFFYYKWYRDLKRHRGRPKPAPA